MANAMKNGVRKRGSTWYFTVHLGERPAQRCGECDARYWIERRPLAACPKCGGVLVETMEKRSRTRGGFPTQKAAKAARNDACTKVGQGCDADPGRLTVRDYLNDVWMPSVNDELQPSTRASYSMHIDRHIVPELGAMKLKALTGMKLREHYAYLSRDGKMNGEGLAPASVRRVRAVMHAALTDAVVYNILPYNPADAIGRRTRGSGKRERPKLRVWTREQLHVLLDATRHDRLYPLWYVVVGTGMRRGEALGLKWESVDMDAATLRVERARVPVRGEVLEGLPKTDHSARCIKLGASTIAVLKAWKKQQKVEHLKAGSAWHETGYVFTNTDGTPLDPRWASRLFARAIATANADARAKAEAEAETPAEPDAEPLPDVLPPLSMHGLRHTYATLALQSGVPVKVVSENLGHANIQITLDFYAHVLDEMRDMFTDQVDDFMFAVQG